MLVLSVGRAHPKRRLAVRARCLRPPRNVLGRLRRSASVQGHALAQPAIELNAAGRETTHTNYQELACESQQRLKLLCASPSFLSQTVQQSPPISSFRT